MFSGMRGSSDSTCHHWGFTGRYFDKNCWISFPVKLQTVKCQVEIRGFVANIISRLTYTNSSFNTLQVNFRCPVDEEAAIYKFEAEIDGRIISTHCLEKKQATQIYENAVRAGNTAILGREDVRSADVFMVNLGNLPPGKTAEVRLNMVMELKVCADGGLSFVMPTILNPRYDPGTSYQNQNSPFVPITTASITVPAQYLLHVNVKIIGSHAISKVESPTDFNNISVKMAPDKMSANVDQVNGFLCNHDWSLLIYYNNPYKMHVLRESGDPSAAGHMKDHIVMINIFPELPSSSYSNKNEIIFVVDQSGSMQGGCIESAKETLLLFLKSLPLGCLFNIVSFGNFHRKLFSEGSREYNEATLGAACGLQRNMTADMGGTDILRPLQDIFSQPIITGFARQVIVLTDGEVWNVKQVTDLIGRNSHSTRLFSVGIGSGASSALVKGMARAGRGRYEMVRDHTNLQVKVISLLQAMLQESVQNVTVSCNVDPVSRVTLVPPAPPIIFGGSHLTLYARILPTTEIVSVTIKGCVGAQECIVTINGPEITRIHDANLSLHRLAARAQILAWETDDEENNKESIIHLSEASAVISRWTALVGVDQDGNQNYYGSETEQCGYSSDSAISGGLFSSNSSAQSASCSPFTFGAKGFGSTGLSCFSSIKSGGLFSSNSSAQSASSSTLFGSSGSAQSSKLSFGVSGFGSTQPATSASFGAAARTGAMVPTGFNFGGSMPSDGLVQHFPAFGCVPGFGGNIPSQIQQCAPGFGGTQITKSSPFGSGGNIYMGGNSPSEIQGCNIQRNEGNSIKSQIEGLMGLVQLQQFNGSWKLDSIAKIFKFSIDSLHQKCPIQKLESDLQYESMRLKTFIKWPLNFINPAELAASGFYYTNSCDHCICVFCKGGVNNWEQGDTPSGEHKRHFPQCPFVLGQNVGNISASEEEKNPLSPNVDSAWATCLALVLLETCFSVQRQQWLLIAMKAQKFLDTNNTSFMIEAAKSVINNL